MVWNPRKFCDARADASRTEVVFHIYIINILCCECLCENETKSYYFKFMTSVGQQFSRYQNKAARRKFSWLVRVHEVRRVGSG